MYEIKSRRLRSQILTCYIFLVLFSKKSRFDWNPSENNVIIEKELDCTDSPTEAATRGVLWEKVFLESHRKTPVPESLFQ